jgi:hypothetical protein
MPSRGNLLHSTMKKKKDEFKYYIIILLFGLGGGHVLEKSQNGCREYNLIIKKHNTR